MKNINTQENFNCLFDSQDRENEEIGKIYFYSTSLRLTFTIRWARTPISVKAVSDTA